MTDIEADNATIAGNVIIGGDAVVNGTLTSINSEELNVTDPYICINKDYTATLATTAGIVAKYQGTSTADTTTAGQFTAGVAATSNPTIITDGSATFAQNDIINIEGTTDNQNDGIYEVEDHTGTTLTVRGVGAIGRVEAFTKKQLVTSTETCTITKVNVAIIRAGDDGLWEEGKGSETGIVFNDLTTTIDLELTETLSKNIQTTGLTSGGLITLASATTVDITSAKGYMADFSTSDDPQIYPVVFNGATGYTPSGDGTFILGFDQNDPDTVIEVVSPTGPQDRRDVVMFGAVVVAGGNIIAIDTEPINLGYNGLQSAKDFIRDVIGPANKIGNNFSANGANLNIDNDGGTIFVLGSNFRVNPEIPDENVIPAGTAVSFFRVYRDGLGGLTLVPGQTLVDPNNYDDGSGTLASVTPNDFTVQVIYISPDGQYGVAYGQEVFNSLATAQDALLSGTLTYDEIGFLTEQVRRTFLIVKQNANDLSDPAQAAFFQEGKFRGGGLSTSGGNPGINTPGGSDTNIQFNQAGVFGGESDLSWDYNNDVLRIDSGTLYVNNSGATVFPVTATTAEFRNTGDMVIQNNAPAANNIIHNYGDEVSNTRGQMIYRHSTDSFEWYVNGGKKLDLNTDVEITTDMQLTGALNGLAVSGSQGANNVFVSTGIDSTPGTNNTAVGDASGTVLTTGSVDNAFLGKDAGLNCTISDGNTLIGARAGSILTNGSENICIGQDTNPPLSSTNSFINIGNTIYGNNSSKLIRIGGSGAVTGQNQTLKVEGTVSVNTDGTTIPTASNLGDDLIIGRNGDPGISILNTVAGSKCSVLFGDLVDSDAGGISYHNTDNTMRFTTNNEERFIIDSTGTLIYNDDTGIALRNNEPSGNSTKEIAFGSNFMDIRAADEVGGVILDDTGEISLQVRGTAAWKTVLNVSNDKIACNEPIDLVDLATANEPAASAGNNGKMWYNTDLHEFRGVKNGAIVTFTTT
jgi:hypothetical protein